MRKFRRQVVNYFKVSYIIIDRQSNEQVNMLNAKLEGKYDNEKMKNYKLHLYKASNSLIVGLI